MKLKELIPVISDNRVHLHMSHCMGHLKYITTETRIDIFDNEYRDMCIRFAGNMEVVSVLPEDDGMLLVNLRDGAEG